MERLMFQKYLNKNKTTKLDKKKTLLERGLKIL